MKKWTVEKKSTETKNKILLSNIILSRLLHVRKIIGYFLAVAFLKIYIHFILTFFRSVSSWKKKEERIWSFILLTTLWGYLSPPMYLISSVITFDVVFYFFIRKLMKISKKNLSISMKKWFDTVPSEKLGLK